MVEYMIEAHTRRGISSRFAPSYGAALKRGKMLLVQNAHVTEVHIKRCNGLKGKDYHEKTITIVSKKEIRDISDNV
jgi:hypothetical protein